MKYQSNADFAARKRQLLEKEEASLLSGIYEGSQCQRP